MPDPHEVAKLQVGGMEFHDWESVYVQHRWQEGWPTFRFTAAEDAEQPWAYGDLKFKPGDHCAVQLGGILAVTGIITNRQVSYSATEHGVQLAGVGSQWASTTSSVPSENNQNNFDGMTTEAIFNRVVRSTGGRPKIIGIVDKMIHKSMQAQPGEPVWDFLDRVTRLVNATLGSDHEGNTLLIGEHSAPVVQELTEGENILKMQAVFSNELMFGIYKVNGQTQVSDEIKAMQTAQIKARAFGGLKFLTAAKLFVENYRTLEIPLENPTATNADAQKRVTYEALRRDGTQLKCNVTVQGWLRDNDKRLWRTGDNVMIHSPMVPVHLGMKIMTATFTQDSRGGTTTLLECVLPWMLGDKLYTLNPQKEPGPDWSKYQPMPVEAPPDWTKLPSAPWPTSPSDVENHPPVDTS